MPARAAPFARLGPDAPATPLVVSVPHAGRHYPPAVLARARVGRDALERLEDRHVDAFAPALAAARHTVLVAQVARAAIDLNRAPDEWDSGDVARKAPLRMPGSRTRAGLGLIPRRLSSVGELWRHRLDHVELAALVATLHTPWHAAVAAALDAARDQFGAAVLIDLHSMPAQGADGPQIVIGDRHGLTASSRLSDALLAIAEGAGLRATRNTPYAGAYGVERHAQRAGRSVGPIEAVQVEVDRTLYLDAAGEPDSLGVAQVGAMLVAMAQAAADHGCAVGRLHGGGRSGGDWAEAAE